MNVVASTQNSVWQQNEDWKLGGKIEVVNGCDRVMIRVVMGTHDEDQSLYSLQEGKSVDERSQLILSSALHQDMLGVLEFN
jgi:hypothetical protein